MPRPIAFLLVLSAALLACTGTASALQLDLTVTSSTFAKLKGSQHVHMKLPDSARVYPVQGDPSAAQQRAVVLRAGSCHLDFTAAALFNHVVGGSTLKSTALDFHLDFVGTPHVVGQGSIHNAISKIGGKKIGAYQSAAYSTEDDPGRTDFTYAAHAVFRFTPRPKRVHGFKVKRPATTETVVTFDGAFLIGDDLHFCSAVDRSAVQSTFAGVIASAQLTN